MSSLATPLLVLIFLAAAGAIWVAGVQLSVQTDVLSTRLGWGAALGGLIMLAVATNLPEVAIVVSASLSGDVSVAVGNILGGVAIQTVVLVALDAFGLTGPRPLTYRAASLVLVLEGLAVVAVLAAVVAGSELPPDLIVWRLTPDVVLIAAIWAVSLLLVRRAAKGLPWHEAGEAPDNQEHARGHSRRRAEQGATERGLSTRRSALIFGVAALVTLGAGVALERSGSALAGDFGLSGVLFGATILAAATSLPEVSTGLTAVRRGDYQLAISDIFGGNAFLPVLFLLATLISGEAVLPEAQDTDVYLTAVAIVLTVIYMTGLLFRPGRRRAGMGIDSIVVLGVYVVALAGLFTIVT